jgi:hypothetical protein
MISPPRAVPETPPAPAARIAAPPTAQPVTPPQSVAEPESDYPDRRVPITEWKPSSLPGDVWGYGPDVRAFAFYFSGGVAAGALAFGGNYLTVKAQADKDRAALETSGGLGACSTRSKVPASPSCAALLSDVDERSVLLNLTNGWAVTSGALAFVGVATYVLAPKGVYWFAAVKPAVTVNKSAGALTIQGSW